MKVGFVSLGCSKNLIDTEMAIGLLKNNNFENITGRESELKEIIEYLKNSIGLYI